MIIVIILNHESSQSASRGNSVKENYSHGFALSANSSILRPDKLTSLWSLVACRLQCNSLDVTRHAMAINDNE